MRAFASGLGASCDSTPARLLHLSPKAAGLLSAYRHDPSWSSEALSAVAEGGVAARAFVGWASELERVYREQPRVEAFLRCAVLSCVGGMSSDNEDVAVPCLSSTAGLQKPRAKHENAVECHVPFSGLLYSLPCQGTSGSTMLGLRSGQQDGRETWPRGCAVKSNLKATTSVIVIFDHQRRAASVAPERALLPKTPPSVGTPRRGLPSGSIGRTRTSPTPGNPGTSLRGPRAGGGGTAESAR